MNVDDLRLERKDQPDETRLIGPAMVTPPIEESYWLYRVMVSDTQAVVGFPKFGTIGIGFMVEDDWNTNLPYTSDATRIRKHIWHNRGGESITKDVVDRAIELIQAAATEAHAKERHG